MQPKTYQKIFLFLILGLVVSSCDYGRPNPNRNLRAMANLTVFIKENKLCIIPNLDNATIDGQLFQTGYVKSINYFEIVESTNNPLVSHNTAWQDESLVGQRLYNRQTFCSNKSIENLPKDKVYVVSLFGLSQNEKHFVMLDRKFYYSPSGTVVYVSD